MMSVGTFGTSTGGGMGGGGPAVTLIDRIRDTFKLAESHGLSFEKAFHLLDRDGSGDVTLDELHAALLKLPNFKAVSLQEVRELFNIIDVDRSGEVSVQEFKSFVKEGKLYAPGGRGKHQQQKGSPRGGGAGGASDDAARGEPMDEPKAKELFVRHIRRIAQIDGSVSGLLAYLDDDEDGVIALTTFKALLRREDVFDSVPEAQVMRMLEPLMQDSKGLRAAALLRFVEGGRVQNHGGASGGGHGEGKEDDALADQHVVLQKEYDFSPDPEIRALEKKVRGFGRILSKKGVDVESLFRSFDPRSQGSVRRTELLEVLSKLGMYILEQGKVFDQAIAGGGGPEQDIHRMQMHQVNRLKGKGGAYLQNAPRMARRMLMNGGNEVAGGDFKVSI